MPRSQYNRLAKGDQHAVYCAESFDHFLSFATSHTGGPVAFLEGYCDESGTHGADHLVVCGFVAEADVWKRFSRDWARALKDQSIPFFKAQWFEKKKEFFRPWKDDKTRRDGFINRLLTVIENAKPQPIGCIVQMADYEDIVKPGTIRNKVGSAYTVAAAQCLIDGGRWAKENGNTSPIAYAFDEGHKNAKEFHLAHKRAFGDPRDRDGFFLGNMVFADERKVMPLQAADLIAYEVAQHLAGNHHRDTFQRIRNLSTNTKGLFDVVDRKALVDILAINPPKRKSGN